MKRTVRPAAIDPWRQGCCDPGHPRTGLIRTSTLMVCALAVAGSAAAGISFEPYEVVTGLAERQTVLTGSFLGGPIADLAVVHIDERDDRRLRIYTFGDGDWLPGIEATLHPDVSFVDVANIDGFDRLIAYRPGRLSWFDPETAVEQKLVAVNCDFNPPRPGGIPHVDVTLDANGDDREDLVVPDVDGFQVFVQRPDGTFADPVKIGPTTTTSRVYGSGGYRHSPWLEGGVHQMDYDRDGRTDLVFWSGYGFRVHLQDERGLFAPEPETFTANLNLDGGRNRCSRRPEHGFDSVRACYESDHSALTTGDRKERMLHAFTDVNEDGVDDLLVFSLEGRSVFSVRSAYEVHFGAQTPADGTAFGPVADTATRSEGMPGWMEPHDFDDDGQLDMMLATLDMGIFKALGGLLTGSTALELAFFRMEGGTYPDKPNATRRVKIDLSRDDAGEKMAAYASVLIGDVNGDRRADLLIGSGRRELRVFAGVPGPALFASRPQKFKVAIPNDERYTWLVDIDQDGKQDILVHHPSTTEPHRVVLLIAR